MGRRQAFNFDSMFAANGKLAVSVIQQSSTEQAGIDAEIFMAESTLDGDLPQTGREKNNSFSGALIRSRASADNYSGEPAADSRCVSNSSFKEHRQTAARSLHYPCYRSRLER